ncbi:MAG: hypothetical protein K2Z81_02215, partial [Cyanobacteria bacterium]|nr:hypothetical protein [Cyanobacteriota bacterium]
IAQQQTNDLQVISRRKITIITTYQVRVLILRGNVEKSDENGMRFRASLFRSFCVSSQTTYRVGNLILRGNVEKVM